MTIVQRLMLGSLSDVVTTGVRVCCRELTWLENLSDIVTTGVKVCCRARRCFESLSNIVTAKLTKA
jgi:hypothetical protein